MAFKRVVTSDTNLQMLQDNVSQALNGQSAVITVTLDSAGNRKTAKSQMNDPFSNGNLIVIALTSGKDNLIPHGLSRVPQVWIIMRQNTNTTVWEVKTAQIPDSNKNPQIANESYLNLWCGSSCQVSVWVA